MKKKIPDRCRLHLLCKKSVNNLVAKIAIFRGIRQKLVVKKRQK